MKRLVLYSAVALVVGACVLRLLQHDSGYVLIVIGGKSIEMRFWAAVFAVLVFALLLNWLLRWFRGIMRWSREGFVSLRSERQQRSQRRLHAGILRMLEGDAESAEKLLQKVTKDLPGDVLAAVAASENALKLNQTQLAQQRLKEARALHSEPSLSLDLAEVRAWIQAGKFHEALSRLLILKTKSVDHPSVTQLLKHVLIQLNDWQAIERLLAENELKLGRKKPRNLPMQAETYRHLLINSAESDGLEGVEAVWQRCPKYLRDLPAVLAVYCHLLIGYEQAHSVEPLLRKAIKLKWDDELVELYGLIPALEPAKQITCAESWIPEHEQNATLMLALARIAMRNQLWGKAREYYESCMRLSPGPVVYAELARLLERLGEGEKSDDLYRRGLIQIASNAGLMESIDEDLPTTSTTRPALGKVL